MELLENQPIFVLTDKDGHKYKIWRDGITEGFPEGGRIVNHIPFLEGKANKEERQQNCRLFNHPNHDEVLQAMVDSASNVA